MHAIYEYDYEKHVNISLNIICSNDGFLLVEVYKPISFAKGILVPVMMATPDVLGGSLL